MTSLVSKALVLGPKNVSNPHLFAQIFLRIFLSLNKLQPGPNKFSSADTAMRMRHVLHFAVCVRPSVRGSAVTEASLR